MSISWDELTLRLKQFRADYCGTAAHADVPLGFLAEMAWALGLHVDFQLIDQSEPGGTGQLIESTEMENQNSASSAPAVTDEIFPAPDAFTPEQLATDPILRYFHFAHLPPQLRLTSIKFFELACSIIAIVPRNAERTVALRKLLEAKDAAVRANVT